MSINKNLKLILEIKGLSQKDLSEKTGITQATISRYINGSRLPSAESIITICEELNISSDWLLEIHNSKKENR
jgi:transcriptional regulator with XRE-family HTH domain